MPAALFLGLLYSFNKLSRDSEIDAFLASGIGLHRLAQPVAILSLILAGCSFLIVGWLQPHARYAYRAVVFDVQNVDVFYLAEEGIFMQAGTRTFILDKLDRSAGSFEHIFLFDNRGAGGIETVTARQRQADRESRHAGAGPAPRERPSPARSTACRALHAGQAADRGRR